MNYEIVAKERGKAFVYTEDEAVAKVIRKLVGWAAIYERNGKVFGWHFWIPVTKLGFLRKQILENYPIANKEVTEQSKRKFQLREPLKPMARKRMGRGEKVVVIS